MAHPEALNDIPDAVRTGQPQARNPTTPGDLPASSILNTVPQCGHLISFIGSPEVTKATMAVRHMYKLQNKNSSSYWEDCLPDDQFDGLHLRIQQVAVAN